MQAVIDLVGIHQYQQLLEGMMDPDPSQRYKFSATWIHLRRWKVVPAEDSGHFSDPEIATLVAALNQAGHTECIAIATMAVDPDPACYRVSISKDDLRSFNSKCGLFRYVLTDEDRTWAISCNEWYNLFAGEPALLEAMLGKTIDEARQEFLDFATLLAQSPDEPMLQVANEYAAL
jgi:hypothetical protein